MVRLGNLHWASGFLEDEGHFYASPEYRGNITLGASQVQREPLDRLHNLFGGTFRRKHYHGENENDQWLWELRGTRAVAVMMTLYDLMSPRRKRQIEKALNEWKTWGVANKNKTHCLHGHPFEGDNLYVTPTGKRECRACRRRRWQTYARNINPSPEKGG